MQKANGVAGKSRRRTERDDAPATFAVTNYQFSHPSNANLFSLSVRRFFSSAVFVLRSCVQKGIFASEK
jgi:hypothetical protein